MWFKYIYIFVLISTLETQIDSKSGIQRQKNALLLSSPTNNQEISVELPKKNNRPIKVNKSHKQISINKPIKLLNQHHKLSRESPVYPRGPKLVKQHRILSENYPIYLHDSNVDKKHQESSNSLPTYVKPKPKMSIKHSKSSKKSPMERKRKKIEEKHSKSLKKTPKRYSHSSKLNEQHDKSVEKPSIYLKPPEISEKSQYRNYRRRRPSKKVILKKKSRKPSNSATDYLNGEENRQERNQHYVRDHEPVRQASKEFNNNNNNNNDNDDDDDSQKEKSYEEENQLDNNNNRVDFHIHGHEGPKSYVFGYDTGKGDNRQFRWEEKHKNGTVVGQYGYHDPRGKFTKVFYMSDPIFGYQQSVLDEEYNIKNMIENESE